MSSTRLPIDQMPGASSLLRDYVGHFRRLAPFYAHDPQDPTAYRKQADACAGRTYPRAAVRDALAALNARLGAPAAVLQNVAALGKSDTLAVCTGQQTGLFGGPIFTLYKAMTAIHLAERLQDELGHPVVPLFWMASEDHDVAEADHVWLPDRTGALVLVRHAAWAPPAGFMPANLRLGPGIAETLAQARACLPETEFLDALWTALGEAYAPTETLADAFGRWMLHLLGRYGLVLVDGADPALKPLAAPVFRQELGEAPRSSRAILDASEALRAAGYPAQIEARPDGVGCFLLRDGRHPLDRDGGSFRLRDTGETIPVPELRRLAEEAPERFSPNVALRPIVQDTLFPTLAYVAGPGELAYFAQLREIYEAFAVPMPLIVPRASFTLIEPRATQLLERFRLGLADIAQDPEQLASRVFRTQLPPDVESVIARARGGVEELFREVSEVIGAVDPTLRATVGQTSGHIKGHLEQLEKKTVQALKRRESDTRQQLHRLRETLMPGGKSQERVLPALPFLAKYGPMLVKLLRRETDGPGFTHGMVRLGTESEGR
jgi:bacillithiol biosynthesis cysteine-adding enzyme BshC